MAPAAAAALSMALMQAPTGGGSIGAGSVPEAMYRADAAHTGAYDVEPVQVLGGLQWRFATSGPVRSTPAIYDGKVYVGSGDGFLYAIDLDTGGLVWRFEAGTAITSSPAVDDSSVYFLDRQSTLHSVDRRAGTPRWRFATGADVPLDWGHESADWFVSSPVLSGDAVIFGSGNGRVYRLDRGGTVVWSHATGGRVRSTPAVAGDAVVVGSMDGSVHYLDLATGRPIHRFDTEGRGFSSQDFGYDRKSIQSSPAILGGATYVGAKDGHLYAIRNADGTRLWRSPRVTWILGGPAMSGGHAIAGTSDARAVMAFDTATGEAAWSHETYSVVWTSPAVAGSTVYAADGSGSVFGIDRATGDRRWQFRAGGAVLSSPVPADGRLVFGSDDGGVYALRAGERPIARAVFWDSAYAAASWFQGHRELRDYLDGRGYAVIDRPGLEAFMRRRTEDHQPSVVVFAIDHLPAGPGEAGIPGAMRRYLEAGGKVVWVGVPPLLRPRDPATGEPTELGDVERDATDRLLGVGHGRSNFDRYGSFPTDLGRRWGLDAWWTGRWAAEPEDVEPLALDENGLAPAWVKSFGGPPGTGFVRVWGDYTPIPDPRFVHTVAEYRPASPVIEIRGRKLWTGTGFEPRTLWAVDGRFTDRRPARVDSVLDLGDRHVVPPFASAHQHTPAYQRHRADAFLRMGVFYTLIMNLHASTWRENAKWFASPSTLDVNPSIAGLTAPDAHPVQIGLRGGLTVAQIDGDWITAVETPEDLERRWPATAGLNRDVVKTFLIYSDRYAGRRGDTTIVARHRGMDPALLPRVVELAHGDGLRVATHVRTAHDFEVAVDAGVDIIAHLPGFSMGLTSLAGPDHPERVAEVEDANRFIIPREVAERAARRGTAVVTTIGAVVLGTEPDVPEARREAIERSLSVRREVLETNLRTLKRAGARVVLGSDRGEGNPVDEALVVGELGVYDAAEILEMLVKKTPKLVFPDRALGSLEPGNEASFLVLAGDPLADLRHLREPLLAFKEGREVLPLPESR